MDFSKNKNILKEKELKAKRLARKADKAVDLVTRTITGLEQINQQIEDSLSEIDTYSENLAKTRENMIQQRSNNSAIIENFSKLLRVGNTDE